MPTMSVIVCLLDGCIGCLRREEAAVATAIHGELKLLCREAQENGDFAECFWLCAQCCRSLESVQSLRVTAELLTTINRLYEDTILRMAASLQSICSDFEEAQYCKAGRCVLGNRSDKRRLKSLDNSKPCT